MILKKELRASKAQDLVNRDIKFEDLVTKNQALDQMILQLCKQPATPTVAPSSASGASVSSSTSHYKAEVLILEKELRALKAPMTDPNIVLPFQTEAFNCLKKEARTLTLLTNPPVVGRQRMDQLFHTLCELHIEKIEFLETLIDRLMPIASSLKQHECIIAMTVHRTDSIQKTHKRLTLTHEAQ